MSLPSYTYASDKRWSAALPRAMWTDSIPERTVVCCASSSNEVVKRADADSTRSPDGVRPAS